MPYFNVVPPDLRRPLPDQYPGVSIGWQYFESAYYARDGRLVLREGEGDRFQGRHHTFVVHADRANDTLTFMSWSPRWGDRGLGYMSREYFERYVDCVLVSNVAYAGPSPAMDRQMKRRTWLAGDPHNVRPDPSDFIKTWMTPNPLRMEKAIFVAGREFVVRSRRVFSLGSDTRPVDLFEVREADEAIARMHVFHGRADAPDMTHPRDETVIEELFVHPSRRRLGLRAALVDIARGAASQNGKRRIIAPLHECDDSEGNADAANGLAAKAGFTWTVAPTRRPNVRGHFAASIP